MVPALTAGVSGPGDPAVRCIGMPQAPAGPGRSRVGGPLGNNRPFLEKGEPPTPPLTLGRDLRPAIFSSWPYLLQFLQNLHDERTWGKGKIHSRQNRRRILPGERQGQETGRSGSSIRTALAAGASECNGSGSSSSTSTSSGGSCLRFESPNWGGHRARQGPSAAAARSRVCAAHMAARSLARRATVPP